MNKLTLSCLKSLVQTRPKGDWKFLTQMVLVWPEARTYYWSKQGFRTFLTSWPFFFEGSGDRDPTDFMRNYLILPEGMVSHGLNVEFTGFSLIARIYDHGEHLLSLVYRIRSYADLPQWDQKDLVVWVGRTLPMHSQACLDQIYKEYPKVKQRVIRALILARDFGKTDIKTLNTLAALTCKSLNRDVRNLN